MLLGGATSQQGLQPATKFDRIAVDTQQFALTRTPTNDLDIESRHSEGLADHRADRAVRTSFGGWFGDTNG